MDFTNTSNILEGPCTSDSSVWCVKPTKELSSLNLSLTHGVLDENEIEIDEDDDIEEVEVNENERLHLQKVSYLVEAAYQRVERYNQLNQLNYPVKSNDASENSSCASTGTVLHAASLPESLDAGKAELLELKCLPASLETALRINQAIQRRFSATLAHLEKTLQHNLLKQENISEEIDAQGCQKTNQQDRDYKEARTKYQVRPSSFSIPYFKDRTGTHAPMNNDAKYKVDRGYLDLYSTRLRTWLTAEQNSLVKEVQTEWKRHLIEDWSRSVKDAERKLKNTELDSEEITKIEEEISLCRSHVTFFTNVPAEKIDMPRYSDLDWDKVAVAAFDGYRSPEECRLLWENELHPSINRAQWSEDEDIMIQNYMLEYGDDKKPNWDQLSAELDTGRTGYQVMKRWVSFIRPAINPTLWTPEGSKNLEELVSMLRMGSHIPWGQIAQHLTGYTKTQLQTRWRIINPIQFRGPFTMNEDFLLIKGLFKFGTNFDIITHFMPGRNKSQVRDRYKRGILPGLTTKPWTWREDKCIIENCSFDNQHWRIMSKLLLKRESCQIRLRFYLLHFWQTISKEKKLPPPLFPLTLTENPKEIKNLREKIFNLDPDVKVFLDGVDTKFKDEVVNLFKEKRVIKKDLEEEKTTAPPGGSRQVSKRQAFRKKAMHDEAITDFFLPYRNDIASKFSSKDKRANFYFHRVSQALQLRVYCDVISWDQMERLQESLDIEAKDVNLVNEILIRHHIEDDSVSECIACMSHKPDLIPLIGPNATTTGAFRSLLLHKSVLLQMAKKDFFLFQVPPSQLHKLGGEKMKVKKEPITDKLGRIKNEINKLIDEQEIDKLIEEEIDETGMLNVRVLDPPQPKRKRRKAAAIADAVNSVYCKKGHMDELLRKDMPECEPIVPPSTEEVEQMMLEAESPYFLKRSMDNESKKDVIEEEDKLLFRRMLSLFFWPSLLTLQRPSIYAMHNAAEIAKDSKLNRMENAIGPHKLATRDHSKVPPMDPDAHEHYIKVLEAVKIRKNHKYQSPLPETQVDITMADMNTRVYKKQLLTLKRSLVVKKAWESRRLGVLKPKVSKVRTPSVRPSSARIFEKINKNMKEILKEEEDKEELMGINEEEGEEILGINQETETSDYCQENTDVDDILKEW